jgi:hypothetical protein
MVPFFFSLMAFALCAPLCLGRQIGRAILRGGGGFLRDERAERSMMLQQQQH